MDDQEAGCGWVKPWGGRVLPGEMDGRYGGVQVKVSMTGVTNSNAFQRLRKSSKGVHQKDWAGSR